MSRGLFGGHLLIFDVKITYYENPFNKILVVKSI